MIHKVISALNYIYNIKITHDVYNITRITIMTLNYLYMRGTLLLPDTR